MIYISWITEFVNKLPELMLYLIQGSIFVALYNFILFKDKKIKESINLIKIVVISYILKSIFDVLFPWLLIGSPIYIVWLCLFGALCAYLIAIVLKTQAFNRLLLKLKIKRTISDNIWNDVIRPNTWLRVYEKDTKYAYIGVFAYSENFEREPIIVLKRWQKQNFETGKIIMDFSKEQNQLIMLNTKNFEKIEIVYAEDVNSENKIPVPEVKSIKTK